VHGLAGAVQPSPGSSGGQPGQPVSTARLTQRFAILGIRPGQARSTALFQLAPKSPPPSSRYPRHPHRRRSHLATPRRRRLDDLRRRSRPPDDRSTEAFRQFEYLTSPLRARRTRSGECWPIMAIRRGRPLCLPRATGRTRWRCCSGRGPHDCRGQRQARASGSRWPGAQGARDCRSLWQSAWDRFPSRPALTRHWPVLARRDDLPVRRRMSLSLLVQISEINLYMAEILTRLSHSLT
jgi:hypothetical protein